VAAVTTALSIPWLIFGITAGALVDRIDRRMALIVIGVLRTAVFALAAILTAAGLLPNVTLLVAAIVTGIGLVMTETASVSLTPQVVASNQLERANARLLTAELVAETGAALVAGALVSVGGSAVFVTGTLCALGGLFALIRLLRTPINEPERSRDAISRRGLLDGFRLLWSIPALRVIALIGAVINTAWTAFAATFVLFAIRPGPMNLSPWAYGLLMTVSIAGGIVGSALAPRLLGRWGNRTGIGLNIIANGVTFAAPVVLLSPWLIGAIFLIADGATPLWRVAITTLQQRAVPEEVRGRVAAAYRVISLGAATAGPAIGLALANQIGARGLFAALSISCIVMLIPFHIAVTNTSMERA
jgi:MFS family permease